MMRQSLKGFLLISDTLAGPQNRLIPLSRLVDEIERLHAGLENTTWTILRGADGYGDAVGKIVAGLETDETVNVRGADVMDAIRSDEQWFDDVFIHVAAHGVDFGVHDSTALFFRGTKEEMHSIEGCFSRTLWLR